MDTHIKILKRRRELGYSSAEQFAFDNKLNRSTYERIEQGKDMKLSTFKRVAECLKIDPKELI